MTEPRIVSPEELRDDAIAEARKWIDSAVGHVLSDETALENLAIKLTADVAKPALDLLATEPDRTRAAVVRALEEAAERAHHWSHSAEDAVREYADEIESGADY